MSHSAAFSLFLGFCPLVLVVGSGVSANAQLADKTYDVTPRPIQIVPSGTFVGDRPPQGWTHLVIKSKPRCNRGDVDKVAKRDTHLASLFSNVFLANVVQGKDDPRTWSIRNLAIGITTPIDGQDVVVAPGQSKALGAQLNILERVILKEIDARLRQITIRALSAQFAVVDINSAMRFEGKNQQMLLRYALVVDPGSGQLHSLVWLLKPGTPQHQLSSDIRLLAPNYVEQCSLHVDHSEYSWGLPSDNAFAVTDLPQAARKFTAPAGLIAAMQPVALSVANAAQLDHQLRQLLGHTDVRHSP